jgi:hypothetical protein
MKINQTAKSYNRTARRKVKAIKKKQNKRRSKAGNANPKAKSNRASAAHVVKTDSLYDKLRDLYAELRDLDDELRDEILGEIANDWHHGIGWESMYLMSFQFEIWLWGNPGKLEGLVGDALAQLPDVTAREIADRASADFMGRRAPDEQLNALTLEIERILHARRAAQEGNDERVRREA